MIKVDTINATFKPEKIGNPNGLQITYLKAYSTRNIFVYHDSSKVSNKTFLYSFQKHKFIILQVQLTSLDIHFNIVKFFMEYNIR